MAGSKQDWACKSLRVWGWLPDFVVNYHWGVFWHARWLRCYGMPESSRLWIAPQDWPTSQLPDWSRSGSRPIRQLRCTGMRILLGYLEHRMTRTLPARHALWWVTTWFTVWPNLKIPLIRVARNTEPIWSQFLTCMSSTESAHQACTRKYESSTQR